ncbi:hypothetical protein H072_10609 [Dactylellina haptotyla CBS 200.50]|uniref:Uncharacterized protein n=1 Tax=Dactylellina haptotyla (strain CBS 200.50) TaxID=1284197 RepID=S7ZZR1_DACHA|nr:hypothetical protein H072_10609 [Dactylellina haptotyla CBS 200.50]
MARAAGVYSLISCASLINRCAGFISPPQDFTVETPAAMELSEITSNFEKYLTGGLQRFQSPNSIVANSANIPAADLVLQQPTPIPPSTYFTIYLLFTSTNDWDAFNISTTDYVTCYNLNPAFRARDSYFRAKLSTTGNRDAQPGVKDMMFSFPDRTKPPDISIKIYRNAPQAIQGRRSAAISAGSTSPWGSCNESVGSRETRLVNIKWWRDIPEDDRLKWLKPRWWAPFYYRLRETDSFQVLPPQGRQAISVVVEDPQKTDFQRNRLAELGRQRGQLLRQAGDLGFEVE